MEIFTHKVENNFNSKLFAFREEVEQVLLRSKHRIDFVVVTNVVASISHWRIENWTHNDSINTEIYKVIQLLNDSFDISDAIAVAVFEGPRIDLIKR